MGVASSRCAFWPVEGDFGLLVTSFVEADKQAVSRGALMADVFISYARSTAESARLIAESLRSAGYSVWFDEEIPAHRAYADVISEKLDEAKAVVVVWSREAAASHWVRSEANRAREKGALVQVNVDASRLPMPFDQIQFIDFRGWRGDESAVCWKKLLSSVAELASAGGRTGVPAKRARRATTGIGRRPLVFGGAAAAVVAAGAFAWWPRGGAEPPPEAQVLHQKAMVVMQDARPAELNQAIAYLVEATRMEPKFAAAWGTLAVSYALRKYQVPLSARAGDDARCRSAAATALNLDPSEPLASCALALLVPPYRNWRRVEDEGRKLARRFADLPMALHLHADVLADVGRWREAVDIYRSVNRTRFFIPLSDRSIILGLWSSGDIQGAENMLDQAVQRWPQHFAIWDVRVKFLTHSGRADEAVRLLENDSARPSGYPEELHRSSLITARAIAGSGAGDEAIRANLVALDSSSPDLFTVLNRKVSMAHVVAQRSAALGDKNTAFALLDGYHRARGEWARLAPAAGDADRTTVALFEPPMAPLWSDARFSMLLREIGLESYWRDIGIPPDFRTA